MLAPLDWIKEYVTLPPLPKLVERLNQTGTTIASANIFGEGLEGITTGQILEVNPHPNADKLQLATVQVTGRKLTIVCGAKNIEAGQKVPVAPVGSSVPNGPEGVPMKIERRKIRDIESNGMLCSAKELGLGDDHSGILILPEDTKVGTKLTSVLGLPDVILDTEVTTNRGDELSIYGLAREFAAVTGVTLKPLAATKPILESKEPKKLTVKVEDPKLSRRYSAVVLSDLKIGPSPAFIQSRLRESGMRPISNVVDITNYVMLLTGQPLHAFDYSKVSGAVTVRESRAGERITTLDGVTRVLGFGSVVIADQEKILGLAGVMGGQYSGVTELTDTIVLESAVFDQVATRRTSMKYNLRSEASLRFERGMDIEGTVRVLSLATELFKQYAGGVVASELTDIYPNPYRPTSVALTKLKLDRYLGYSFPLHRAATSLAKLGFKPAGKTKESLAVSVPSWRASDVSIEEDLIEEVARLEGYDQIPSKLPTGEIPAALPSETVNRLRTMHEHLASLGLQEVQNYSFVSEDLVGESALKIANSISKEWEYLRTSLIPGLAQTAAVNLNFGSPEPIFEVGKIYQPKDGDLPYEKYVLALTGSDFETVKGYFTSLLQKLGVPEASYLPCEGDFFTTGTAASVWLGETVVGEIGTLSTTYKMKSGLRKSLVLGEFDVESILAEIPAVKSYQPVAKFPVVREDISILLPSKTPIAEVVAAVLGSGARDIVSAEPFDIFADAKLGLGKKSVSLSLSFQSREKTLTDEEVKEEKVKIEKALKEKLGAKIR